VYGKPKIGKTTFASQFPEALFLVTEPGTKGLSLFEEEIVSWVKFLKVIGGLQREKDHYKTVVIDTVDRLYDLCMNHVCARLGIPYPGVDEKGRDDYGKSWRDVRTEFLDAILKITQTGRGIIFVSHDTEATIRSRSGGEYDRVIPSMSKQARLVVVKLADIVLYADYFRTTKGKVIRAFMCTGDETVLAGHRKTTGRFPDLLPLLEEGGYEAYVDGFHGRHPGIDPKTVMQSRLTAPAAAKLVRSMAVRSRAERRRRKKEKASTGQTKRVPKKAA